MAGLDLSVLTLNTYLGAELDPILAAGSPAEVIDAAATAWKQIRASNIPERAEAIANEIAASSADLVGLQEVVEWHHGSPGSLHLEYDFLELILASLNKQGCSYAPLAINQELDQIVPISTAGEMVRLVDRHAVLLKSNSATTKVQPYNVQQCFFETLMPLKILGMAMEIARGWIAIDASLDGAKFRLLETHLESFDASVQLAQARELIAGPAGCDLPLILIGDFNSNGDPNPDGPDHTATYGELVSNGFTDIWTAVNPDDPGYSGVQAPDLRNPESSLDRRIDLALTRGQVIAVSAKLLGATPSSRTASGLWPSDHAGVLATVRIG